MGIEDHLLALAHVGAGEHHPAVAEAEKRLFLMSSAPSW